MARIDGTKVRIFDGQHKTVARILLGEREILVRLFLETDPAKLLHFDYEMTSANFRLTCDVSDLKPGTYRIYLDVKTDAARDVFELYNMRRKEAITSETETLGVDLHCETTHSRYVLKLTDLTLAH